MPDAPTRPAAGGPERRPSGSFECWPGLLLSRLRALARLQPTHALNDEVASAIERQDLGLRAKDVHTDRLIRVREQLLPFLNPSEDQGNELCALELAPSRIDPDDGLVLLGAQKDHVVVRRDDDLVGLPCVIENDGVI